MTIDLGFERPIIHTPLSYAVGIDPDRWSATLLGRLNKVNEHFWLDMNKTDNEAEYTWRVVDAFLTGEDTQMTRFWCYSPDGESVANPDIYVEWAGGNSRPIDTKFTTVNVSGYFASVRSKWPSERFSFGFVAKDGGKKMAHDCLVIVWRLFGREQYENARLNRPIR